MWCGLLRDGVGMVMFVHRRGENAMPLPRELWDDVVPEQTTVVGDIDFFILYCVYGYAWRDWCNRVQYSFRIMNMYFGMITPDIKTSWQKPPR
jgi:hypothetical protein